MNRLILYAKTLSHFEHYSRCWILNRKEGIKTTEKGMLKWMCDVTGREFRGNGREQGKIRKIIN